MFDKRVSLENWTKNHKTGLVEQVNKVKPACFMKGKAHIQVFDDKGNVEQEAVTENVINTSINRAFNKKLLQSIQGTGYAYDPLYLLQLFGRLVLNNYTTAENSDLALIPSQEDYPVIGWAHIYSTYTGEDTKRGTLNTAESSFDYTTGVATLVFDWPTNSGNGTFQSLFWYRDKSTQTRDDTIDNATRAVEVASDLNSNDTFEYTYGTSVVVDDWWYFVDNNKNVWRSPRIASTLYGEIFDVIDSNMELVLNDSVDLYGVQWDGTYFYVLASASIRKFNSSWEYQSETVIDGAYIYSRAWCVMDGAIFVFDRNDIYDYTIRKIQIDTGTVLNTWNFTTTDIDFTNLVACTDGTYFYILQNSSSTGYIICDASGNISTYKADYYTFSGTSSSRVLGRLAYDFKRGVFVGGYFYADDAFIYLFDLELAPSAHTLLASPVTKTDSNTMKITYTFTFDMDDL